MNLTPTLQQEVEQLASSQGISPEQFILQAIAEKIAALKQTPEMDAESKAWLEADLAGDLPEYDWGEAGIPPVQPIRFIPGEGFVIDEVK